MIYAIIGCFIIIGFLAFKLFKKREIDDSEWQFYQKQLQEKKHELLLSDCLLNEAKVELNSTKNQREQEERRLTECKKDLQAALDTYQNLTETRLAELDKQMEEQREKRQGDLDRIFEEKQKEVDNEIIRFNEILKNTQAETEYQAAQYWGKVLLEKKKFEGVVSTLAQYEKEQQEKLFYTIQLQPEYYEDIEFLLTTVAAKVQHPDIISKLVWAEYVKPNLDNTFKRLDIKPEPGIYKLTSLQNGKCYIGKSTNVKNRIADHFKSVVGIKSIADQAVHHAILKEGFWNWTIEVITYCDKEKLSELEKYYIDFFKAQEFGYNKNSGGGG